MAQNNPDRLVGPEVSRRGFLKSIAAGTASIAVVPKKLWASGKKHVSKGEVHSVLVDLTRCIGCRSCSRACQNANRLPEADTGASLADIARPEIPTYSHWSVVNLEGPANAESADQRRPVKRQCMHCLEPACVSVCPVGALDQTATGPVIYREERCIGCRYCMVACPFDVPKFDWSSGLTPVIGKCQFCAQERLFKGLSPACAESCPTGALKFGKRQSLLFEARARIRSRPEKYVNHVYGEKEIGGTSWLYLSDVPFEKLGFKTNLPDSPLPSLTWEVISRLPVLVAVLVGLFGTVATTLSKGDHT